MAATTTTFPWKRNLAVLWVAQVVTTLGFSFTFPFYPIFFQSLGVDEVERAAFLSGVSGWMMGVGMGLFAPFWGIIGDRYGRRRNIIRAMLLGGAFLVLSGYSQNPTQLVVSRFLIGATSGVVPTIMALVAGHTPRDRLPLATGLTMAALFLGTALGPLFGGVIFDHFGMRASFWATGLALFAATVLVVLFAREDFKPPRADRGPPVPRVRRPVAAGELGNVFPVAADGGARDDRRAADHTGDRGDRSDDGGRLGEGDGYGNRVHGHRRLGVDIGCDDGVARRATGAAASIPNGGGLGVGGVRGALLCQYLRAADLAGGDG